MALGECRVKQELSEFEIREMLSEYEARVSLSGRGMTRGERKHSP